MDRKKIKEILNSLTENQELLESEDVPIEMLKEIVIDMNLVIMLILTEYPIIDKKVGDFYI